jgi:predicted deacetylase
MPPNASRTIAVALHDIEPSTFERCALIRDWLDDHGVDRVTLLVIPASDLHPLADRRPEIVSWIQERIRSGDAVAQHGFQHRRTPAGRWALQVVPKIHSEAAEFAGLDASDTARALDAGRRVLKLAGIEANGFVAPAYAYTPALRAMVGSRFDWWAGSWGLYRTADTESASASASPPSLGGPAFGLANTGVARRIVSPVVMRAAARITGPTLRLDLHPNNLTSPSHMLALDSVLRRSIATRRPVTYEELAAAA